LRFGGGLDANPFHAPRVGVDNLDVESGRVAQNFAALRKPRR